MYKKPDRELLRLQEELLAAEAEALDLEDELDLEEFLEEEDYEDCFEDSYEEEYDQASYRPSLAYSRGSQKKFEDRDFFEEDVEDEDVLYHKDYKKAKRKKRLSNLGLLLLALLELAAIAGVLIWWSTWAQ